MSITPKRTCIICSQNAHELSHFCLKCLTGRQFDINKDISAMKRRDVEADIKGVAPRHVWLQQRLIVLVNELQRLQASQDWDTYRSKAVALAEEILYAAKEWDKYYE